MSFVSRSPKVAEIGVGNVLCNRLASVFYYKTFAPTRRGKHGLRERPGMLRLVNGIEHEQETSYSCVLSASVGAGHLRAASGRRTGPARGRARGDRSQRRCPGADQRAFRRLYGKFYLDLVNKAPHVLGYFYDLLDQPSRSGKNRTDRLRLAVEKLNLRKFIRFLQGGAVGPGHQHAFPARGDHRLAAPQRAS